jgi:phage terminase large subunit-like protein
VWVRDGFLNTTPGNVIDYRAILSQIDEDAQRFDVVGIAYDRWGMTQLSQDLQDAGMMVVAFGQGFASMSAPTKEWERLILEQQYRHGANPVMRWMVDNIVVRTDPAGNLKIDKGRSTEKVDGAVAAVMALDGATRYEQPKKYRAAGF